jgi:hypothetical protein
MSQTIGNIRVKTNSLPVANVNTGGVKIAVNSGNPTRVQSIQYISAASQGSFSISDATDIEISNNLTGRGVLTYNENTQEFIVQDLPRLNGGTF